MFIFFFFMKHLFLVEMVDYFGTLLVGTTVFVIHYTPAINLPTTM